MVMKARLLPILLSFLPILSVQAQNARPAGPASAWKVTLSQVWSGDSDLDQGGRMRFDQTALRVGFQQSLGRGQSWGLGLDAVHYNYDFAGPTDLGQQMYWNKVNDIGVSASWRRPVGERGMVFLAPSLTVARANGADWGDALRAGGVASYGLRFSDSLTVGFGAGFFTGMEDTKAFPVLLVSWQINEKWRMGNPFRPGPAGPAGLEVAYAMSEEWEVAFGGGWRSHRFRLDEDGPNPGGIAEVEGFPGFVRLTWSASEMVTVDFYGGMLFAGEVTMEDEDGNELFSDDMDRAPLVAFTVQAAF